MFLSSLSKVQNINQILLSRTVNKICTLASKPKEELGSFLNVILKEKLITHKFLKSKKLMSGFFCCCLKTLFQKDASPT